MLKIRHPQTKLFFRKEVVQKPNKKPTTRTSWVPESQATVFKSFEDNSFLDACQQLRSPLDFVTVEEA